MQGTDCIENLFPPPTRERWRELWLGGAQGGPGWPAHPLPPFAPCKVVVPPLELWSPLVGR